jgi:ABC-type multidrug transport system fused ATPase/permease subunit
LLHGVRCAIILLVPLSEDEQRILLEIEQRLTEEDPDLVREVASTTVYTHALRNLKLATLLFVVGVVAMIWLLSAHAVLAFGGFLIMLVAALVFERNARRLGKAGLQQLTQSMRGAGVRDYLGATSQRMRDRFKRDDEA